MIISGKAKISGLLSFLTPKEANMDRPIIYCSVLLIVLLSLCSFSLSQQAPDPAFAKIDQVFGQTGKSMPGNVQKYSWPRTDLHVSVGGTVIAPALALGSWSAFQKAGNGNDFMAMGDLVLLGSEVNPVISELQAGGFEILAVHNHLINETPEVIYVHFEGHGAPEAI